MQQSRGSPAAAMEDGSAEAGMAARLRKILAEEEKLHGRSLAASP